ncbi:unnamed protein product [Ceratitis capitata]|uniref:(Mediterranean fruit fly) hypothetical protein n=1 Tax=Ceratitis capitata TaxID=7213 RepID=A0A811UYB8_CERCA|nr:unnamed protein product [Ceratitis capitata]CAD7003308.1 unnamed protein product [Ceratitis capitata]
MTDTTDYETDRPSQTTQRMNIVGVTIRFVVILNGGVAVGAVGAESCESVNVMLCVVVQILDGVKCGSAIGSTELEHKLFSNKLRIEWFVPETGSRFSRNCSLRFFARAWLLSASRGGSNSSSGNSSSVIWKVNDC